MLEHLRKYYVWVVTLLALILRLIKLDTSMWYDEGYAGYWSRLSLSEMITFLAGDDIHPPLYLFLSQIWAQVFPGDLGLRYLTVLLGTVTVAAFFQVTRKMFDFKTAAIAAAFLAVSPFHVELSQELRPYALFTFLSVVALWVILRLAESETFINRWGFAYSVVAALLQYTHGVGALVIAGLICFHLCIATDFRKAIKQVLLYNAIAVVLFLPWAVIVVQQAGRADDFYRWLPPVTLGSILTTMQWFVYSPPFAETPRLVHWLWLMPPALLVVLALFVNDAPLRRKVFGLAFLVLVPVALISIYGYLKSPVFVTRVLSPLITPLCMLLALPAAMLKAAALRQASKILAVLFFIFSLLSVVGYLRLRENTDWRGAAEQIAAWSKPDDAVIILPTNAKFVFGYYYAPKPDSAPRFISLSSQDELRQTLPALVQSHPRIWVVRDDVVRSGITDDAMDWLKANHEWKPEGDFHGLSVLSVTPPDTHRE